MKDHSNLFVPTIAATSLLLTSFAASAGNSTRQPIATHFAQTQSEISLDLSATSFSDVELDEADSFDGWTAELDLTVPLNNTMQLRFSLPFYTDGDARLTNPSLPDNGQRIDIDGNTGVLDFMRLEFEHQLTDEASSGYNAGYTVGYGHISDHLETTASDGDLYNHAGRVFLAGVKADGSISGSQSKWLVNAGIRYYFDTDDLHPDDRVDWTWADIKTAIVFEPWGEYVQPVLEVTYLGDFSDYNAVAIRPELIVPFSDSASFKLGGIYGLTNDGNQAGVVGSVSFGF